MKRAFSAATRMAALAAAALLCAVAVNALRRTPLPWRGEWSRHIENRALQAGIPLAGLGRARSAAASRDALLLDARDPAQFRAGRLPGAVSLPLDRAREQLMVEPVNPDPDHPMIVYCGGLDCDDALDLALLLRRFGYRDVALFAGGWAEWQAAGGAAETGP